jgi:hypothetical protein
MALDTPARPAERIVGEESPEEARDAVRRIAQVNRKVAELMAWVMPEDPERRRPVRTCPHCDAGRLHCIGRQRLPDGSPGVGGVVVCDGCGYYGGRR